MALSKKQVKQLRAMANQLNPLLYIGKNDLTDAAVKQASETMDSHELLKVAVQDGSGLTAKEAADKLAGQIGAQVVQVIGTKQYVRLYERVGDSGRYVPIALDMVAV